MSGSQIGFRTFVFDCDGVLLNSNRVKTEGFRRVASRYGDEAASALVRFHVENGGVSRFRKFRYLIDDILAREARDGEIELLCDAYSKDISQGLQECRIADGLYDLRAEFQNLRWMVVSGGAESELRDVLTARGIAHLFDAGIYGSPATKDEILAREVSSGRLILPAVFFGDSAYDHQASQRAGLHFAFVSGWSEFGGWQAYCGRFNIPHAASLREAVRMAGETLPPGLSPSFPGE